MEMQLAQATAVIAEKALENPAPTVIIGGIAFVLLRVLGDLISRALPFKKIDQVECKLGGPLGEKMDHHFHDSDRLESTTERISETQVVLSHTLKRMCACMERMEEQGRRVELGQTKCIALQQRKVKDDG